MLEAAVAVMVVCAIVAGAAAVVAIVAARSVFRQIRDERAARAGIAPAPTAGKGRAAIERHQLTDQLQRSRP